MRNLRRFIERRRKIRDRESNVKWKLKTKVAWMADQAAFFDRSPFKSDQERRDAFLNVPKGFAIRKRRITGMVSSLRAVKAQQMMAAHDYSIFKKSRI